MLRRSTTSRPSRSPSPPHRHPHPTARRPWYRQPVRTRRPHAVVGPQLGREERIAAVQSKRDHPAVQSERDHPAMYCLRRSRTPTPRCERACAGGSACRDELRTHACGVARPSPRGRGGARARWCAANGSGGLQFGRACATTATSAISAACQRPRRRRVHANRAR